MADTDPTPEVVMADAEPTPDKAGFTTFYNYFNHATSVDTISEAEISSGPIYIYCSTMRKSLLEANPTPNPIQLPDTIRDPTEGMTQHMVVGITAIEAKEFRITHKSGVNKVVLSDRVFLVVLPITKKTQVKYFAVGEEHQLHNVSGELVFFLPGYSTQRELGQAEVRVTAVAQRKIDWKRFQLRIGTGARVIIPPKGRKAKVIPKADTQVLNVQNNVASVIRLMIGAAANDPENREVWLRRLNTILKSRCKMIRVREDDPISRFFTHDRGDEEEEDNEDEGDLLEVQAMIKTSWHLTIQTEHLVGLRRAISKQPRLISPANYLPILLHLDHKVQVQQGRLGGRSKGIDFDEVVTDVVRITECHRLTTGRIRTDNSWRIILRSVQDILTQTYDSFVSEKEAFVADVGGETIYQSWDELWAAFAASPDVYTNQRFATEITRFCNQSVSARSDALADNLMWISHRIAEILAGEEVEGVVAGGN